MRFALSFLPQRATASSVKPKRQCGKRWRTETNFVSLPWRSCTDNWQGSLHSLQVEESRNITKIIIIIKIRIMAGNMPTYFPDKHLKQKGPSEAIHTHLNIPGFWLCRRVSALNCQLVGAIREPGLAGTQEIVHALLLLSSPDLPPGVCTAAELGLQPLFPLHPNYPVRAGRDRGTAESRLLLYSQHSASLSRC